MSQGGARDLPRVPPGSKKLKNGCQNDSKIINKCCPEAFWKRFSKTHALSMFLNSSGLFFVCSYSCRGGLSVTFIQVKSQHSSTWLGGKTYGGSPLLPDVSKIAPPQERTPKKPFHFFVTWKSDPQKWSLRSPNGVPQMAKNRSKIDKMPVLKLVLKNALKNCEKPCFWILKNSGFAL